MKQEKRLMNQIRLYCGEKGWVVIRNNVGTFELADGRFLSTGLPKGWPDLMILTNKGNVIFVETKVGNNKPSKIQQHYLDLLNRLNFDAFVCYSIESFISKTKKYV